MHFAPSQERCCYHYALVAVRDPHLFGVLGRFFQDALSLLFRVGHLRCVVHVPDACRARLRYAGHVPGEVRAGVAACVCLLAVMRAQLNVHPVVDLVHFALVYDREGCVLVCFRQLQVARVSGCAHCGHSAGLEA